MFKLATFISAIVVTTTAHHTVDKVLSHRKAIALCRDVYTHKPTEEKVES